MKNSVFLKALSFTLAILLLGGIFAACKTTSDNPEQSSSVSSSTDETEENSYVKDDLPDYLDYEGTLANILVRGDATGDVFMEDDGEIISEVMFNRFLNVEDRLKVDLEIVPMGTWQDFNSYTLVQLRASINSWDGAYDMVAGWSYWMPSLAMEGYVLDLNQVEYLNFDKPWWSSLIMENASFGGQNYFASGDISLLYIQSLLVTYYNKQVAEDYASDINFYDLVLNNEWTFDKMNEIVRKVGAIDNGDTVLNEHDTFAYVTSGGNFDTSYLNAARITFTEREGDGYPSFKNDMSEYYNIVDDLYHLMWENTGTYRPANIDIQRDMFEADQALLSQDYLSAASGIYAPNMESDYGILPYPMYSETQDGYGTRTQEAYSLWSIPLDVKDASMSGALMEALACYGYNYCTPTYFDQALKIKYNRDELTEDAEKAREILDIIRDSTYFTFEQIYNASLGEPWNWIRELMKNKSRDAASDWNSKINTTTGKLNTIIETYEANRK